MSGNSKDTGPKRSSSNRRYLFRVMRGDISPHDEVCQSGKQITGDDARHGSIKHVASAVGKCFIAIELANQHLDRF